MRKLLSMFFVMVLALCCICAVSCKEKDPDTPDTPAVELSAGMKAARNYIQSLYKDKAELTASEYTLLGVYKPADVEYVITWTVEVVSGVQDGVYVEKSEDGKTYTVKLKEKLAEETVYNIKAVITSGDEKCELSYKHVAPQYRELTWAEYVATADGDPVVIKGIVSCIASKSKGNSYNCVYLQDETDGGYYVYGTEKDPVEEGIQIGMTVRVTGIRDTYSGTYEIKQGTGSYEIIDSTIKTITPIDLTEAFTKATSLKDESITARQGMVCTIKGVTIADEVESSGYYYFELGGKKTYMRISSSICPLTKEQQETFKADHKSHLGWIANVTGTINVYDGSFYLYPINDNMGFEYVSLPEKTDAEAVAFEKENLGIETLVEQEDQIIELPISGTSYTKVAISWALKEANENVTIEDNKISAKMVDAAYKFTVVATLTAGEATDTVEIEVSVDAASTEKYLPVAIEEAKVGTYKFAVYQAQLGEYIYADGTFNENEYMTTTTKAEKGADFTVALVDGKTDKYTIKVGEQFFEVYENANKKVRAHYVDAATGEWSWDADAKTYTYELTGCQNESNNTVYYFGTYNALSTLGPSKMSYIQGENAAKIGVSQFPVYMSKIIPAVETLSPVEEAKVGTFKFAVYQAQLGEIIYADGIFNENEYMTTTTKSDKAAEFTVALVDGKTDKYTIKLGEQFLEVYENANKKVRAHFVDAATGEWSWDADAKTYTYELTGCQNESNNTVYYFGTYNALSTFGPSKMSYIQGENAAKIGVSQFPAYMSNIVLVEAVFVGIEEAVAGTYKLGTYQTNVGVYVYCDGLINTNEYMTTTEKYAKAADFVIEAIEGQDGKYTIKCGEQYLEVYENSNKKVRMHYVAEPTGAWEWNDEVKIFTYTLVTCSNTYNIGTYWLGTYNTLTTIGPSKLTYITGDKASDIGVSEFVTYWGERTAKVEEVEVKKADVKIDWADGTVGQGYTSPNWKQEGWITDGWKEFTDKMNCRQSPVTSTKVVNMVSGWSMEYRYTYSTGESLGLANKLTMVLGNYFNNPEVFGFRVYAHDKDGNVVYLVGTADAFVDYPVTTDVETVTYTFDEVELMDLIIDCKSKKNDNAFLYCGGIELTWAEPEKSAAEKVAAEKKDLAVAGSCAGELTVATKGATYDDVTISWALKEANANVTIVDGKVTATKAAESYSFVLVATLTCGEATDTKEFEVAFVDGPYAAFDPSTKAVKQSTYADKWTYKDWNICGGANNNAGWDYLRFGPKAASMPANPDFYIATKDALLADATTVEVSIGGNGAYATKVSDTAKCEIYIECYEDAAYTKKVGTATASQTAPAIANKGDANVVLTFTGNWAKGTYIKVVFNITNTSYTSNGLTAVAKVEVK